MDNKYTLLDEIRSCDKKLVQYAKDLVEGNESLLMTPWLRLHVCVLKVVVASYASASPTKALKAATRALLKKSMKVDEAYRVFRTNRVTKTIEQLDEVING